MNRDILLVGSLAFDILFSIPQDFRKSIPLEDGSIRSFNASYVASEKQEHCGGCAGNIAWWLGRNGIPSTIFSAFGKDFSEKEYRTKLESLGIRIVGSEGVFTAHAYQVSDPLHQQLIIWQPNAYEQNESQRLIDFLSTEELSAVKFAVFSAGTPRSFRKHIEEFRRYNQSAFVLFDPGQITPLLSAEDFLFCAEQSNILVGNDIEFRHFRSFGIPEGKTTIETCGARGATLTENGIQTHIPAEVVTNVVETTGAGDAFRAGFLAGLSHGKTLPESITLGCSWGAKCVQLPSAQEE